MLLTRVINAGVKESLPSHLQKKVRMANILALFLLLLVAVPFFVLSIFYFPAIAYVPMLGVIVCCSVLIMNGAGAITTSRVVISYIPIVLAAAFQSGLTAADESPILGVHLIELSFALAPFLVFDFRERIYLISSVTISTIILISYPYTSAWWEPAVDATLIRDGFIGTIAVLIGVLCTFSGLFTLIYQNFATEQAASQLLEETQQSNIKFAESEQELKESIQKIELAQQKEKKRQWIAEGVSQINQILRDHEDTQSMSDCLIAHIIQHLNANQGGMFVVDEEGGEKYLKLQACYAYERKKYLEKRIEIGEGLVGQAYLEREYTLFTEIPEDYLSITSGLGKANPRSLLIMPLMLNEEVEGLLEIASFQVFEAHEIEFVQQAGGDIAATLRNSKVAEQTKLLLEESQQQSEEMRAQEEEVRQNMEELTATQEEMSRLLTETKAQEQFVIDLIDATSDTIFTIDRDYSIGVFNKAFQQTWEAAGAVVKKGVRLSSFYDDPQEWKQHESLFQKALSGENFSIKAPKQVGEKEFIFTIVYSPIRNQAGEVVAAAVFARDITALEEAAQAQESLLQESQQQNEELQAQEEEMRQNMEELQAIQEEMERKQLAMEAAQQEDERVRQVEKERADEQLKARTTVMDKAMTKFKQTEQQLKENLKQKDEEILKLTTARS